MGSFFRFAILHVRTQFGVGCINPTRFTVPQEFQTCVPPNRAPYPPCTGKAPNYEVAAAPGPDHSEFRSWSIGAAPASCGWLATARAPC